MCICEDARWDVTVSRKSANEVEIVQRRREEVAQPVAVAAYQVQQAEQVAIELDHSAAPQTIQAVQPAKAPRQRQQQRAIVKAPSVNWGKGLSVAASTVGMVAGWSLKAAWLTVKATVTLTGKIALPLLKVTGSQSVHAGRSFKQAIANSLNQHQAEKAMQSIQQPAQPVQPVRQPAQPQPVAQPDLSNLGSLKRVPQPVSIPVQPKVKNHENYHQANG